jgi:hypothetical protein
MLLRDGGLRRVHADDDVLVFMLESTEQTAQFYRARRVRPDPSVYAAADERG